MNYFERLARRARLQPSVRPGVLFEDPFEQTADWPLETPVAAAPAPVPYPAPLPNNPQQMTSAIAPTPELDNRPEPAALDQLAPPPRAEAIEPMPVADAIDREHIVSTEEHSVELEAETPPMAALSPLAHADAFLRTLGVRVPGLPEARPQVSPPPATTHEAAVRTHDASVAERPQVLAPPEPFHQPSTVEPRPEAPLEPAAEPEPREGADIPRPVRQSVATREVVVIEHRSSAQRSGHRRPISGVGAPHVGLGQL